MMDFQPSAALARIGRRLFQPALRCSFCGRGAEQVERLVAGASALICDDCITKCLAVLEQHPATARSEATEADRPREYS